MDNDQERGSPEDLGQDAFVERLRPDPSQPPERVRILEGLLGDSDKEGYKRLYFTRELDHYAEFRTEDVVFRDRIPSEQSPLVGLETTRVGIRWDATIEYTWSRTPRPVDEFDLDIRLGAPGGAFGERRRPTRRCETRYTRCNQDTCTCATRCGQDTCFATCNQFTCATVCATCGRDTCLDTCGCPTEARTCNNTQCNTCPCEAASPITDHC
jgi:hypothetical protein